MTTKRKPYVREMKPTWWKSLNFYKLYIYREFTSLFTLWFSIVLLVGLFSDTAGFLEFLQNPIVYALNLLTLGATMFHAVTWFNSTPKAVNLIRNGKHVEHAVLVKTMWVITAVVSVIILALAFM